MNLGMAIVAWRNAVCRAGGLDLIKFKLAVFPSGFLKSGLQETAAAAAAVIVRPVGRHINIIFFTHHGFDDIPKVFGHRITQAFSNQLTRILGGKFYFQILVPVGTDFELSVTNPLGIVFNDASEFKIVRDVEFFQSGPDCKEFMPSFRVQPDFAP
jgi:hypothetical protein